MKQFDVNDEVFYYSGRCSPQKVKILNKEKLGAIAPDVFVYEVFLFGEKKKHIECYLFKTPEEVIDRMRDDIDYLTQSLSKFEKEFGE